MHRLPSSHFFDCLDVVAFTLLAISESNRAKPQVFSLAYGPTLRGAPGCVLGARAMLRARPDDPWDNSLETIHFAAEYCGRALFLRRGRMGR